MSHSTIRSITASLLLVLFGFSITPKKLLHDWVANHKDTVNRGSANSIHVSDNSFNCNCDNLVAESPFTRQENRIYLAAPAVIVEHITLLHSNNYSSDHFILGLRGPPGIS